MNRQEDELKQLFLAEASEQYEALNRLFTGLEKNHADTQAMQEVFRITHTLKANAAAMGFEGIAEVAHLLEDIFSLMKSGTATLTPKTFNDLFRANDKLGEMLVGIREDRKVAHKGMLTKLKVILRDLQQNPAEEAQAPTPAAQAEKSTATATGISTQKAAPSESAMESSTRAESPADEATILQPNITFSDVVQVPVKKLDALLTLVSELAIEKDRLLANHALGGQSNEYAALNRITSDLQYSVMGVRLVQVNTVFQKFHRIVRDVAKLEGKQVRLALEGTEIEIDRNVLQIISDSLIHLVRNAISHGLESPSERAKAGKPPEGTLLLQATNEKDQVVITVRDNGRGINPELIRKKVIEKGMAKAEFLQQLPEEAVIRYIFEPGFSSAEKVTEVSGRGVGMDVVRRITEAIGGKVHVRSKLGEGTSIRLTLPSSMAVKSALLFIANQAEFAVPLAFTEAVVSMRKSDLHRVGKGLVGTYLQHTLPVVFLTDLLQSNTFEALRQQMHLHPSFAQCSTTDKLPVLVVAVEGKLFGLVVETLLQQKEIIEKPLASPLDTVHFVSGATILGNGKVCLVLDTPAIADFLFNPMEMGTLTAVAAPIAE